MEETARRAAADDRTPRREHRARPTQPRRFDSRQETMACPPIAVLDSAYSLRQSALGVEPVVERLDLLPPRCGSSAGRVRIKSQLHN